MMWKKRIGIAAIVCCLIGIYGARVYAVNEDTHLYLPKRQVFEKGEKVAFETDYNVSKSDMAEGYTIQVLDSKLLSAEEFFQEYDAEDMGMATHYYMVKVCVENVSNEHVGEQGVATGMTMLVGTNYAIIPSPDMFRAVNPDMPAQSFSLQLGTKKEIWLVFSIIPGNTPDYKHIEEDTPMLQITQYPNQKLLQIL
ncbi:DUF5028 domain-containing protein [Lachnoclostridium sp. An181]|uniref:DUF5028 domain-containing protein n=1 Tax=Lachnoclostridium sp. An181 TaxID=1965575 RepID=UPI000B3892AA|nr:DUF5028 domain-containing protein [Lachnoclostridium sp. An181]OUP50382.1 hypothetical protein B5F18_04165 [Lachnoclostridium sp. An181]